uniref:Uncharacterized protein n=1 Tax=Arundo donax TaxID=35708 RepID=A0A0A9CEW1_ARUDO
MSRLLPSQASSLYYRDYLEEVELAPYSLILPSLL